MAAALPTLAFAEGGVPEQIADGSTGFLAPPGGWADIATVITSYSIHYTKLYEA